MSSPREDDFTDTVDAAATYQADHFTDAYPPDDRPTPAELAQDDADLTAWYAHQADTAARRPA